MGVGPGAELEVLVCHIPVAIGVVVVVPLAVRVYAIIRDVRRTWVHAGIAVIAVHFVGPGVAIFIHAVVDPHVAGIPKALCTCFGWKPDG